MGSNLGLREAVVVVAAIVREFRPRLVAGHRVVPDPKLSLRVRGGLPMVLHRD